MKYSIPLVDFAKCGLHVEVDDVREEDLRDIGEQLYSALSTAGFAYLTNHGIPRIKTVEFNETVEKFFALPHDEKMRFAQRTFTLAYDPLGKGKSDLKNPDHYEGFRTSGGAYTDETVAWPDIPGIRETFSDLACHMRILLLRLLKALGLGMKLKDPNYFCNAHSLANEKGSITTLKAIRYPPITNDRTTEHRIGEHSDKTSMTLLFQDEMGGLQIKDSMNHFVDVTPLPDAIVLNIGDLLEVWSGNRLKATKHRVRPPLNSKNRAYVRRSIAYFGVADNDVMMRELEFKDEAEEDDIVDVEQTTVETFMHKALAPILYSEN